MNCHNAQISEVATPVPAAPSHPFTPIPADNGECLARQQFRKRAAPQALSARGPQDQLQNASASSYALWASALALAGRIEEAKPTAPQLLELEPTFRLRPVPEAMARASARAVAWARTTTRR